MNIVYGKCHHGHAWRVLRIQDHGTADERFSFSVIRSYLSKRNYPALSTLYKRRQTCSQKKGETLRLYVLCRRGLKYKSLHVISSDNCDWLFAERDSSTLRRLLVEDHEQRKRIVATIHDSNSNTPGVTLIAAWNCSTCSMYTDVITISFSCQI